MAARGVRRRMRPAMARERYPPGARGNPSSEWLGALAPGANRKLAHQLDELAVRLAQRRLVGRDPLELQAREAADLHVAAELRLPAVQLDRDADAVLLRLQRRHALLAGQHAAEVVAEEAQLVGHEEDRAGAAEGAGRAQLDLHPALQPVGLGAAGVLVELVADDADRQPSTVTRERNFPPHTTEASASSRLVPDR